MITPYIDTAELKDYHTQYNIIYQYDNVYCYNRGLSSVQ